jgi:D-alanyl-D-alanine carboxypeptidase/D-alanyl-D-alanine-endopeptidase (penicillin-binding protein 4)
MVPASTMKLFTGWFGFIQDQEARRRFPSPFGTFLSYAGTMLRSSVNPMASHILKTYGGATSMVRFLAGLGLPTETLRVADGAGLRQSNRASARAEVALLEHILNSPHYMEYRALMAQPGSTGTLRGRMPALKGSLYAKTGTLPSTGVVSLAGFIDVGNAGTVVFAIIGNNSRISVATQRDRIDRVVLAVRDLASPQPGAAQARAMRFNDDLFARLPSVIAGSDVNP